MQVNAATVQNADKGMRERAASPAIIWVSSPGRCGSGPSGGSPERSRAWRSVARSWRGNLGRSCRLIGVEEVGDAGRPPVRGKLAGEVAQAGVGPGGFGVRGQGGHLGGDTCRALHLAALDIVFGEPAQIQRVLPDRFL